MHAGWEYLITKTEPSLEVWCLNRHGNVNSLEKQTQVYITLQGYVGIEIICL